MIFTPWGYQVAAEALPPLLSVEEFNSMTANKWAKRSDLESTLEGVSAAIRLHCGWHVAPELPCVANFSARGRVIRLPALYVSAVGTVTEDGTELAEGQWEWRPEGLLRRCCFRNWSPTWGGIDVAYTAGLPEVPHDLKQLVAHRVLHTVALPFGVRSETTGDQSITYTEDASLASGGVNLSVRDKLALEPYVLPPGV